MQVIDLIRDCKLWASVCAMSGLLLVGSGCGGGTTGTSSGETFKLLGVTESASQLPLQDTSMSVLSGTTDQVLLESQTSGDGDFSMQLPSAERSLIIDVNGVRSSPLERKLAGESIISTKLRQDSLGELSFSETFEAQVDIASLCPALTVEDSVIYQTSDWDSTMGQSCQVKIIAQSEGFSREKIQVAARAECLDAEPVESLGSDGTALLDLTALLTGDCGPGEISISADGTALLPVVFPIVTLR